MKTAASVDNFAMRDRTYQLISRKFTALTDVKRAEESALAIERETARERALDDVAKTMASKVRPTEALGRVRDFDSRRQKVRFLIAVAKRI